MAQYFLICAVVIKVIIDVGGAFRPSLAWDITYIIFLLGFGMVVLDTDGAVGVVAICIGGGWAFYIYLKKTGAILDSKEDAISSQKKTEKPAPKNDD